MLGSTVLLSRSLETMRLRLTLLVDIISCWLTKSALFLVTLITIEVKCKESPSKLALTFVHFKPPSPETFFDEFSS
jgi:hypothetical protein